MLNRTQLIQACKKYSAHYSPKFELELALAKLLWMRLLNDQELFIKIQESLNKTKLPYSSELRQEVIVPLVKDYTAYALDGSQIYSDRHAGLSCYLINIGKVALKYGSLGGAWFDTRLSLHQDISPSMHQEVVNAHRGMYEFEDALTWCSNYQSNHNLLFVDGSLIFWHLVTHDHKQQAYLQKYLNALQALYEAQVPFIGYISLPKSKELVFLAREAQAILQEPEYQGSLEYVVDSDLVENWITPYARTTIFEHKSELMLHYPEHLRTYFFYLHVGEEIARVEFPQWLIPQVNEIAAIALDQALKGHGYPVCLAEAHEQAVVTTTDRDFFYQLLHQQKTKVSFSQKLLKKRLLDI